MEKQQKVHEKFLYEIWKTQNFEKNLTTSDGQKIEIIDVGIENKDLGGPDFLNARIKIGNITYNGDVEIDSYHSDWKAHGHYLNKRYNSLILHATLNNETRHHYVFTQEGRKVQSVSLDSFIKEDVKSNIQKAILSERKNRINRMPCSEVNLLVNEKEKLDFITSLGVERFKSKSNKMLERLKEITYLNDLNLKEPIVRYDLDEKFYNRQFSHQDFNKPELWYQLFFETTFEALGYSKNKEIMHKLAESIGIKIVLDLSCKENFIKYVEALLFNVSGLLPETQKYPDDETAEYVRNLVEKWSEIKSSYDGKTFSSTQWHFFKLRPQNFPTIRIAGGSRLLNRLIKEKMFENLIELFEGSNNYKKLTNSLRNFIIIKGDGFWHSHYVFDQPSNMEIKYFIGLSRADEIIINVLLPILSIYFEIYGKHEAAGKVLKLYLNYFQKSENHLVDEVATTLALENAWKRSVLYQGMIELFRNYCSKEKCRECSIGSKIFN